jgi:peptidoglycan/xylan/chitin deacetylase (PgdA/CDA1 family)
LISVSLDLDNKWSYMKTHGDAGWEDLPTYLDPLAEIVLEQLRRRGLTITFFVVGQDAALDRNRRALEAIAAAGHEIGNHSFHHEPWLHLYSAEEVEQEIARAEEAIEGATGQRPVGFRGPGFSISAEILRVLARRGYRYDASTFPTYLGPLARAYYFWQSRGLSAEEREKRARLFGEAREGLRPLRPYLWEVEGEPLVEIPVTTMPLLRVPIHLSYLLYLATYSQALARAYLGAAVTLCRLRRLEPSLLLHPLDFLGGDRVQGLEFFPGMRLRTGFKTDFFNEVMDTLQGRYDVVTLRQHAAAVREAPAGSVASHPLTELH